MPDQNISVAEAALWALVASGTALFGWFGWLVILWIGLMALDYLTGSAAAAKAREWNSQRAREGLWHKGGMIVMVAVSILADIVVGMAVNHMPMLELPVTYSTLISPLVLTWYCVTELGSILENGAMMGAPIPPFLVRMLKITSEGVSRAGDRIADGETDGETDRETEGDGP